MRTKEEIRQILIDLFELGVGFDVQVSSTLSFSATVFCEDQQMMRVFELAQKHNLTVRGVAEGLALSD